MLPRTPAAYTIGETRMMKETGDDDEGQVIRTARSNDETSYISFHLFITFFFLSIHSKSGCPGCPDSAENSNFPQKVCLRTRKLSVSVPES